jgi:hypothetical protein
MMLLALHLFPGLIPDADLILHYGDGCVPNGMPVICRCSPVPWIAAPLGLIKGNVVVR